MADKDVMERLMLAMESIAARQPSTGPDPMLADMMTQLSSALVKLSESNIEGAKIQASETRRAHRPSNEVVPGISVFNRRGVTLGDYQKPELKCHMMIPWLVEWVSCTREEVELLNLLEQGTYTMKRSDGTFVSGVTCMIATALDGTPTNLIMSHETAFNNEGFRLVLSLPDHLRYILKQHKPEIAEKARRIISDEEEAALIAAGQLTISV